MNVISFPDSTTNLLNHIRSKHPEREKAGTSSEVATGEDQQTLNAYFVGFKQDFFEEKLVELIAGGILSFEVVELPAFRSLVNMLNSNAKVPSADTMKRRLAERFAKDRSMKLAEIEKVGSKISFSTDCWTGKNCQQFCTVTSSYISENWELKTDLLDFIPLQGSHTGARLCEAFESVVRTDFKIDNAHHGCVTLDNASNNGAMMRLYREIWDIEDDIQNRCCAHCINLAAQESLKILKSDIHKLREAIRTIRASPKFLDRLKNLFVQLNGTEDGYLMLVLDCRTRWNSTLDMLKIAIQNKAMAEPLKVIFFYLISSSLGNFSFFTGKSIQKNQNLNI